MPSLASLQFPGSLNQKLKCLKKFFERRKKRKSDLNCAGETEADDDDLGVTELLQEVRFDGSPPAGGARVVRLTARHLTLRRRQRRQRYTVKT